VHRILAIAVTAPALCGCGVDYQETAHQAATPVPDLNGCTPVKPAAPRHLKASRPQVKLDPAKVYVATVTTNCGRFTIRLADNRAPKTSASFKSLADQKFYDGLTFHRVVANFVIQGGDPLGDGTGDPGYRVVEAPSKRLKYTKGVVAMAKTVEEPRGSSGSQFFVVTGSDASPLPPDYALLGHISSGAAVVAKIGAIDTDPSTGAPRTPVVIESIRVSERSPR
jgi:peptidyl-prolyl cis-trans isomerase B (cyclophilin B)